MKRDSKSRRVPLVPVCARSGGFADPRESSVERLENRPKKTHTLITDACIHLFVVDHDTDPGPDHDPDLDPDPDPDPDPGDLDHYLDALFHNMSHIPPKEESAHTCDVTRSLYRFVVQVRIKISNISQSFKTIYGHSIISQKQATM